MERLMQIQEKLKMACIEEEEEGEEKLSDREEMGIEIIVEDSTEGEDSEESESLFSFDINEHDDDDDDGDNEVEDKVYVAVGKSESSLYALAWTLKHAVSSSTLVHLLHVFPRVRYIPTPLGMLPRSRVNAQEVEKHLTQERNNRAKLLQKYLNLCSAFKVKADTSLIEGDAVSKAIIDLIPILDIRKLVLGISSASLRKLMKSKRACGIADQVLENAPDSCEVIVMCEGQQVAFDQMIPMQSPYPNGTRINNTPLRSPLVMQSPYPRGMRSSNTPLRSPLVEAEQPNNHAWKWLSPFTMFFNSHRRYSTSSGDSSVGSVRLKI